jgi:hypothetical protein
MVEEIRESYSYAKATWYKLEEFLKDICAPKNCHTDIYFMRSHSYPMEKLLDIRPLFIKMYDPKDLEHFKVIYKKEIDELMDQKNPIFRDIRASNKIETLGDDLMILRYYGSSRGERGRESLNYRIVKSDPNGKIEKILNEKYHKLLVPNRENIYKLRDVRSWLKLEHNKQKLRHWGALKDFAKILKQR